MTPTGPLAASDETQPPPFTLELLTAALTALPIAELQHDDAFLVYPFPIVRCPGDHCWEAVIDLPPGVTGADLEPHQDLIAAGLQRPSATVTVGHIAYWSGRVYLSIADQAAGGAA